VTLKFGVPAFISGEVDISVKVTDTYETSQCTVVTQTATNTATATVASGYEVIASMISYNQQISTPYTAIMEITFSDGTTIYPFSSGTYQGYSSFSTPITISAPSPC